MEPQRYNCIFYIKSTSTERKKDKLLKYIYKFLNCCGDNKCDMWSHDSSELSSYSSSLTVGMLILY